jgi:NDP-sugar pyrophosphorylase family protein
MKDIAVVYMCAGMSSRFGGRIKQFAKVGPKEETLIEYSMNQAIKAGFSKIVFIVGNMTEKPFKEKFGTKFGKIPIFYALQKFDNEERDKPWGTAEAVVSAKPFLNCPFVVCNGDDIYGENTFKILAKHLYNNDEEAIPGYKIINVVPKQGSVNRGLLEFDKGYLKNIREIFDITLDNFKQRGLKKDSLVSMNIYAFHPSVLNLLSERVDTFKSKNKGNRRIECLLPDEIGALIGLGKMKIVCLKTPDKWIGITNPEDEESVRNELNRVNE